MTPSIGKHAAYTSVILAGLLTAAGCQNNEAARETSKQTWRFAIEEAEGSVQHAYAMRFKQLIEVRTAGEVEVIVYPYGALGTSTQITEQLNLGVIELAMASPGSLGKFIPEMQVFLLHFVLPEDDQQIQQVLSDSDLVEYLDELYAPKGLKLLSIYSEGEMVWTMKKQVRSPEDFRGVKMRVMTSPLLLAAYSAYGASPAPMPYSEVYSGLQLNLIDGQVNPVFAIERQNFHEVTSWMIFPGHTSFVTTCAANRDFFDGLSPARREIVTSVIEELDEYIFEVQTRFQTERLKTILGQKKDKQSELNIIGELSRFVESLSDEERAELIENNPHLHVHSELTSAERESFRSASSSVREVFERIGGARGREVLNRLLTAAEPPDANE